MDEYRKFFRETVLEIHKGWILMQISQKSFTNFYDNIHPDIISSYEKSFRRSFVERELVQRGIPTEILGERDASLIEADQMFFPFYRYQEIANTDQEHPSKIVTNMVFPLIMKEIDFGQVILSRSVVMLVGYLEGFLLRSAGEMDEKLKSEGGRFNATRGSFSERLEKFDRKYKIDVHLADEVMGLLDEANLSRNIILHNSSVVSKDYVEKYKDKRIYKEGDTLIISEYFVKGLFLAVLGTIGLISEETILKIEKKERIQVMVESSWKIGGIFLKEYLEALTKEGGSFNKEMRENNVF